MWTLHHEAYPFPVELLAVHGAKSSCAKDAVRLEHNKIDKPFRNLRIDGPLTWVSVHLRDEQTRQSSSDLTRRSER